MKNVVRPLPAPWRFVRGFAGGAGVVARVGGESRGPGRARGALRARAMNTNSHEDGSVAPRTLLERVRESAWFGLLVKGAAFGLVLGGLGLLGSGAFDRWVTPKQAAAAQVPGRPGASARASASARAEIDSTRAAVAPEAVLGSTSASGSAPPSPPSTAFAPDGRLVLNLATAADLDRLPGIGTKKAEAIVALREKLGGKFKRFEELLRVRGIKRKQLDRLRALLVLDLPGR